MLCQRNFMQLLCVGKRFETTFNLIKSLKFSHKTGGSSFPIVRMLNTTANMHAAEKEECKPRTPEIIAVGQMCSTSDKAENLCQVQKLIEQAKDKNARMLFLPECCDFVGENRKQTLELSEPLSGPTMQRYKALAKEHGIWLSLGGLHESNPDATAEGKSNKIHNAHVLIDQDGEVVEVYRKLHMFNVDTPDFRFRESEVVAPGSKLASPINTPIGCLGLQICYDMRFAEASLLLRKWGAEVLTYPSAFAYHTGKAHWEILLRARAIENQCFVVAAAQIGFHNAKRQSWGHAMIVDPWGKVLADCGGEDKLAVAVATIDLESVNKTRVNMPTFDHRRNDIYTLASFATGTVGTTHDHMFANNVIRKETIFYETEHSFAFTNLKCVVDGHVLVSTKRRTPRLHDLECDEMADLFTTVCKIQRMLEDYYKTTSATVTVQDGPEAGQTVPHVHFHIMPRRKGDFGMNDQIYVKLEDRCENKPDRTIEERIDEAQSYRDFLLNNKKN